MELFISSDLFCLPRAPILILECKELVFRYAVLGHAEKRRVLDRSQRKEKKIIEVFDDVQHSRHLTKNVLQGSPDVLTTRS